MWKFTVFLLVTKLSDEQKHCNTRGIQKEHLAFYFMVFKIWTFENFTEHYCSIAESTVNFQCSIHLCRQSSSTLEYVFSPSTNCSFSSVVTGVWHSAMPLCPCRLFYFFRRPKQVITWCCEVRTVGWMQLSCPSKNCGGLCYAPTWDRKGVIFENFLPRRTMVNSNRYTATHRSLNACLVEYFSQEKFLKCCVSM